MDEKTWYGTYGLTSEIVYL